LLSNGRYPKIKKKNCCRSSNNSTQQAGYISGETLQRIDKPGETVVVSTWERVEDWNRWVTSPERSALQVKINNLLGKETKYEIYSHSN
jgi:heme-degrading monooxygenase HmoA